MKLALLSDDGTELRTFRNVEKVLDTGKLFLTLISDILEAIDYYINE